MHIPHPDGALQQGKYTLAFLSLQPQAVMSHELYSVVAWRNGMEYISDVH